MKIRLTREIKRRIPADVLGILNDGIWLAGGVWRCLLQDKPVNDYDIFCRSYDAVSDVHELLGDIGYVVDPSAEVTQDGNMIYVKGSTKVDLVQGVYYRNMLDAISDFDLTINQFISDGRYLVFTSDAISDLVGKVLRETSPGSSKTKDPNKILAFEDDGYSKKGDITGRQLKD